MFDPTTERVINEAALAKRFETEIDKRANRAVDIPALVDAVNKTQPIDEVNDADSSPTNELEIGIDTDGVPYLK